MASASPLKDIDDKFCLCSICLEQLKEPKVLSCLHRFCKSCLNKLIQQNGDIFRCPECREEIQIPSNGVEGFKTDFYMVNLVEYIQIQQSLQRDERRNCCGCSKEIRVIAFCFKCNDFLCKECYNFHVTYNILKDHKKHTLSLEDIESRNITIEKLAFMQDAPRCQTHPGKISELYCETCRGLPVCIACMLGEHKGHDLHEVGTLAKLKREELAKGLKILEKMEIDNFKPVEARQAKEKLQRNANSEKKNLIRKLDEKIQKLMKKIGEIEEKRRRMKQEKQNVEREKFNHLQKEMENEIEEVEKKYEEMSKKTKLKISRDFQSRERSLENELAELKEKLDHIGKNKEELLEAIEKQVKQNESVIDTISEHFDNIKRKFEMLNMLASSILASENEWSAVQCIPNICTAASNLMEDFKKKFPKVTALTDVTVNYQRISFGNLSISKISEEVEKQFTVSNTCRYVNGITSSGDGTIVLSGCSSACRESFIVVIDMNGRIVKEDKINSVEYAPERYCDFLSPYKVATVSERREIGVYDVRKGSLIKIDISDVISSWPKDRNVACVATDPISNHILVRGCDSKDVYVFDHQLKYLHILTLPEMIKWPRHITVSDGHLLVCDYDGKKCYITTMEELKSKVVGEFIKPNLKGDNFAPICVCTDKSGFVYILWKFRSMQCYLVQYVQDGSQILTTRKLDEDARVVTTVVTSVGERLVVATRNTRTVYMYKLTRQDALA